jgi:hypothetical protein
MDMAVDQAGHQCAPAAIDDAGVREPDRLGRDFPDAVAFDHQFVAAAQFPDLGIEHFEILEVVDIHRVAPDRLRPDGMSYAGWPASICGDVAAVLQRWASHVPTTGAFCRCNAALRRPGAEVAGHLRGRCSGIRWLFRVRSSTYALHSTMPAPVSAEVATPEDCIGSVIADLNLRRGQIEGQDMRGNATVIRAMVPLMTMFGYVNNLRSMSRGRAAFTMQFDHYASAPLPEDDPPFRPAIGMRA